MTIRKVSRRGRRLGDQPAWRWRRTHRRPGPHRRPPRSAKGCAPSSAPWPP